MRSIPDYWTRNLPQGVIEFGSALPPQFAGGPVASPAHKGKDIKQ
jgi:hypothetical protein